jgi:heptose-I-phosphate ethanolaminephosphotransferase
MRPRSFRSRDSSFHVQVHVIPAHALHLPPTLPTADADDGDAGACPAEAVADHADAAAAAGDDDANNDADPAGGARPQALLPWPRRTLVALAAANLFLLSPVMLDDLGLLPGSAEAPDKIALFALPASVLWLALCHVLGRRPVVVHALLLPFYVVVGVDLFLLAHYGTRLSSSMIAVFLQNSSDAAAYLREHRQAVTTAAAAVVGLWVLSLWGLRGVVWQPGRTAQLFFAGSLCVLYGALFVRQASAHGGALTGLVDVASHDRSSPFGVIPQSLVAAHVNASVEEHAAAVSAVRFDARRIDGAAPTVAVLVIGESARPDRWGLYDPARSTTPRLQGIPGIIVFRDVLTQAALTQLAVPLLLTRGPLETFDALLSRKSVLSAAAEAGFRTAWLSTQQRDQWTGAVNLFSSEAEEQRYFDRRHDDVLVQALADRLARLATEESALIVLHTQGSHFTFKDRYPEDAAVFSTTGSGLSARDRMLNEYDNTVAFTDQVLADAIGVLEDRGGDAVLLYVADHGENLRDDDRQLFGHFIGNEYDLRVPMFLWASSSFADRHPRAMAAARDNAVRPVSTASIFSTLLQATDILVEGIPDDEGLLSPRFAAPPRRVLRGWTPVDADSVIPRARRSEALTAFPGADGRRRQRDDDRDP